MKKLKSVTGAALVIVLLLVFARGNQSLSPGEYATNSVNRALAPLTVEDCTNIEWYEGTNTYWINPPEFDYGENYTVIVDIPIEKMNPDPTITNKLSSNVVGYITFTIPYVNTPPTIK